MKRSSFYDGMGSRSPIGEPLHVTLVFCPLTLCTREIDANRNFLCIDNSDALHSYMKCTTNKIYLELSLKKRRTLLELVNKGKFLFEKDVKSS